MAAPDNIDHFNHVVLHTFDRLYSAFPVPTEIKVAEISDLASPGNVPADAPFKMLEPTFEAIRFLKEEGFLNYSNHYTDGTAFLQVQLTMKGLAVLGQAPDSLERRESFISRIRSVLAAGAKDASSEAVKQVVSQLFTMAVAVAPSATSILSKP